MASPNLYQNGVGGTAGATLATVSPLYCSGDVWYVHSGTGSDAASPRGKERIRPLATLAQALTNAAAGDIVVCLSGHAETLTSSETFAEAGIVVVGEGSGASRPRFTRNADVVMFNVTAAGVSFHNIFFPISGTSSTLSRVKFAAANCSLVGCYFECGANDDGPSVETVTGASQIRIAGSTYFVSTVTDVTTQPESAINITNALTDLEMDTVIFDGGSSGWADPYAFNGAAAITRLRAVNVDLLGDSDMILATGTSGYVAPRNKSGSARIVWAA